MVHTRRGVGCVFGIDPYPSLSRHARNPNGMLACTALTCWWVAGLERALHRAHDNFANSCTISTARVRGMVVVAMVMMWRVMARLFRHLTDEVRERYVCVQGVRVTVDGVHLQVFLEVLVEMMGLAVIANTRSPTRTKRPKHAKKVQAKYGGTDRASDPSRHQPRVVAIVEYPPVREAACAATRCG